MACFLVPTTEAIITTIVEKAVKAKGDKKVQNHNVSAEGEASECKIALSRKLGWLNKMLWGGSALLAFEHIWHGEVSPFFPFLTAMENTNDAMAMLHEMSTVGVSMAALVTVVWGIMVAVVSRVSRKNSDTVLSCEEPVVEKINRE